MFKSKKVKQLKQEIVRLNELLINLGRNITRLEDKKKEEYVIVMEAQEELITRIVKRVMQESAPNLQKPPKQRVVIQKRVLGTGHNI